VLILLNEKYPQVTDLDELVPLSLQIARFKIMAQKRKAVRRGEYTQNEVNDLPLPDPGPDPAVQAERKEMTERLVRAMAQLGERCRELFRLKLEGLDFAEIQKRMGAGSINTVYTWDFRCRKNLLELMGGRWEAKP
jgi:RNA polymerase sigma-70 factor (ECF subfamily)